MKLKRWLMPIINVLIIIAMFALEGLLCLLVSDNISAVTVITVVFSQMWIASNIALTVIYAIKCLKICKQKLFFVLYNAFLLTLPVALSVFLTHNGLTIPISLFLFVACTVAGIIGSLSPKQNQPASEYTNQFDGVSTESFPDET